jgi:hypothetical protein
MMTRNDSVSTLNFDVWKSSLVHVCGLKMKHAIRRGGLWQLGKRLSKQNPFLHPLNSTIGKGFHYAAGMRRASAGEEMMAKSRTVVIASFEV